VVSPSLKGLSGWGGANHCRSWVYTPCSRSEVADCVSDALDRGWSLAHRGMGLSYGDAALNEGGAVIDLTSLNKIVDFDPDNGVIRAESGCTIEEIWKASLSTGWWPPVVPGTTHVTLGGAVAMNVHGKNHVRSGSVGDHVLALTLMASDGAARSLDTKKDRAPLMGTIGAQGLTGTILDVTLKLRRVHSGYLEVESRPFSELAQGLDLIDAGARSAEYAVGWVDCFSSGSSAGRGVLHLANDLPAGHELSGRALDVDSQFLSGPILGILPRKQLWRALRLLTRNPGMRIVNAGKNLSERMKPRRKYFQTHAAFHFLLDSIPDWRRAYGPEGFIQYQFFVAREAAQTVFGKALRLQHTHGVWSYLGVIKCHRTDRYASQYSVDGFSLALDFPVQRRSLARLMKLLNEYNAIQRDVGGRVYAAKDSVGVGALPDTRDPRFSSNLVRRWERGV